VKIIKEVAESEKRIKLVEFSYNHGKQLAITAAIQHATGDFLIYMDSDLQDPPAEIPRLILEINKGYDLVFGIRKIKMDSKINVFYSKIFWWILNKFTGIKIPTGLAVMRIFTRQFANKFLEYSEQNRFIEGIFIHVGMKQSIIEIEQRERFAGQTKFNFRSKIRLALDAIFDFSELPLKLAVKAGVILSIFGFISLLLIVIAKLFIVDFYAGWPSIISVIIFGLGVQLFFIGIIAIYVGKIYKESKRRPLFSIKEKINL
jgi:dolichol-phosphate mannosyltransferase